MIDVVVPASRSADEVRRTVSALRASVAACDGPEPRLVIVDDRPDRPDSAAFAAAVAASEVVRTRGRRGPGAARNIGAARGRAPWILFCDDDVEVDRSMWQAARSIVASDDAGRTATVGALRPPATAPAWLRRTYEDGSQFSASADLPEGILPPSHLCAALALVPRRSFEAAGGYPEVMTWEDAILGLRLQRLDEPVQVMRRHGLSGTHWNVPEHWAQWIARQDAAGRRLAALADEVPADEHRELVSALNLASGWKGRVKHLLALVPTPILAAARGPSWRRAAASAAFTAGYLSEVSASRSWSSS